MSCCWPSGVELRQFMQNSGASVLLHTFPIKASSPLANGYCFSMRIRKDKRNQRILGECAMSDQCRSKIPARGTNQ